MDALTAAQDEAERTAEIANKADDAADAAAARVADLATAIRILQGMESDDTAPLAFSPKSAPGAWPARPNPSPGFVGGGYADDGNPHHDDDAPETCNCQEGCAAGLDFATCWNRPATVAAFVAKLAAITDNMQRTADASYADTQWALARIEADRRRANMMPGPDGRGCPDHPDGSCFDVRKGA